MADWRAYGSADISGFLCGTTGAGAGRLCAHRIFPHSHGVGIGAGIPYECLVGRKVSTAAGDGSGSSECGVSQAGLGICRAGNAQWCYLFQADLGRLLELGSTADDNFRIAADLRGLLDAAGCNA